MGTGPRTVVHIALAVTNQQRSRAFYETYLGFDPRLARFYDDNVLMLANAANFHLALKEEAGVKPMPDFFHFGFRLDSPSAMLDELARFKADGIPIVEHWNEPDYVSFKCLDPDGYKIEVSWEPEP